MELNWASIITHGLSVGIGLAVGLVKPTTDWYFEKLRKRREYREKIIADCYTRIEKNDDRTEFRLSQEYARIKPFLSEKTINSIEGGADTVHVLGRAIGGPVLVNSCIPSMHSEISRLEKIWGLK